MFNVEIVGIQDGDKIVIPYSITRNIKCRASDYFVVFGGEDYVFIKKIERLIPKENFFPLAKKIDERFKMLEIYEQDFN